MELQMPQGVSSQGPVQDLSEAYLKAVVCLPEILAGLVGELENISSSLGIIALYCERRGLKEELISQEDVTEEGEGEDGEN